MENMTTAEIREIIEAQTTFDGKLLPDMTEAYKIKELIDELLRRSAQWETKKYCSCPE